MTRFLSTCVFVALSQASPAVTFEWTGAGDGTSFYQEANWQLQGGGAVTGNPLAQGAAIVQDLVFTGVCPNTAANLDLGGLLQISGGELTVTGGGTNNGSIHVDSGGTLNTQWISGSSVTIANGEITVRGGADPLPSGTTIACTGSDWSFVFEAESVADATTEHLGKFTINGAAALIGTNCTLTASGAGSVLTPLLSGDSDDDGLPDSWEMEYFGNLAQTATGDPDGDLLDNAAEQQRGTHPGRADTDSDGLTDLVETGTGTWSGPNDTGTDPLSSDTDDDGLPDGVETRTGTFVNGLNTGTDPFVFNSDNDRIGDGYEVRRGTDPNDPGSQPDVPNVIFIMADDLGYNHLSCYGQTRLTTPHLDTLAAEGMRFTDAYAGCTVCGPSRSSLLTGIHSGHIPYKINGGHVDITDRTPTVAEIFKQAGYMTGAFGKWGIGGSGSGQTPNDRGFDRFYGMLDQGHGHRHYPSYLIEDGERVATGNTTDGSGNTSSNPAHRVSHTHDVFTDEALDFIDAHHNQAFFCYLAFTLPHTEIIATAEEAAEFANPPGWGAEGIDYNNYTANTSAHLAQPKPHTHFAGELRMIDNSVGAVVAKLVEHDLTDNTLIIFTSDNGGQLQAVWGNAPSIFFGNNGILRGGKQDSYEGGLRVPFIAKWPGQVPPASVSDLPTYFADFLPTVCDLVDLPPPALTDGLSILPTLTGDPASQKHHPYLYWCHRPSASVIDHAVRAGKWKAVKRGGNALQLYDLETDPSESTNVAGSNPAITAEMQAIIDREYMSDLTIPAPSSTSPTYPNHPISSP